MLPNTRETAVADVGFSSSATPSVIPVGHAKPGRTPTVAVVGVRVNNNASNSYCVLADGVNPSTVDPASVMAFTAVLLLVVKSFVTFT